MTTAETETSVEPELFDAAVYDIEGTPELNGRKAKIIVLSFDPYELDRTDVDHMELAGKLEPGEQIRLELVAKVQKRTWGENEDEVRVVYRLEITDVSG